MSALMEDALREVHLNGSGNYAPQQACDEPEDNVVERPGMPVKIYA